MKDNVREMLQTTLNDKTIEEQFFQILELPDEKFDAIYPQFSEAIQKSFHSKSTKNQLADQLALTPVNDLESEIEGINNFIEDVKADDSLSENKKELIVMLVEQSRDLLVEVIENPRDKIPVQVIRMDENVKLPTYAHKGDGGADIYANEDVVVPAGNTVIVKTGLKMAIPLGYMVNIVPRSGLSLKTGLRIPNSPAVIDSQYRQEVGVIISNTSSTDYTISKGDRIAQMLIMPVPMIQWEEVDELDETERAGGFGSTGA